MLSELGLILLLILARGACVAIERAMMIVHYRGMIPEDSAVGGMRNDSIRMAPREIPEALAVSIILPSLLIGMVAGIMVLPPVAAVIQELPMMYAYGEGIGIVLLLALLTYSVAVFGTLVPQRLVMNVSDGTVAQMQTFVSLLGIGMAPLTWIIRLSMRGLTSIFWGRAAGGDDTHAEEPSADADTSNGSKTTESRIAERVFRFGGYPVRQIMTPRMDVYGLNGNQSLGEVLDELIDMGFSRMPVYDDNPDQIIGTVHVHDILKHYHAQGKTIRVREIMQPPFFVPEHLSADDLVALFRKNQRHLAIVVNELGGIEGIVTLEDVLEEIVGDIVDEYDDASEPVVVPRADGSLLMDGTLSISQLKYYLDIDELPEEEFYRFDTLAGFLLSLMAHIPREGEMISWGGWCFEVVDMDGLRIDKVLVVRQGEREAESQGGCGD